MIGREDERKLIAIDSVPVSRTHETTPGIPTVFNGHLAVAVSVGEVENLAEQYEAALEAVFSELGLDRLKRVYKAYEIAKLLGGRLPKAEAFYFRFSRKLLGISGLKLNVFFGEFDIAPLHAALGAELGPDAEAAARTNKVVPIYGGGPGRTYVTMMKFLDKMQDIFPIAAAWKLQSVTGLAGHTFLLDGFQGHIPKAWYEVTQRNYVQLVPHGDQCNPFLSSSDLLLRGIVRQLVREHLHIGHGPLREAISRLAGAGGAAEVHTHRIGNDEIPMVAPYEARTVSAEEFARHPLQIVVREVADRKLSAELEDSPLMKSVLDRAYGARGSVLVYDPAATPAVVRPEDWVVTYGPNGAETVKRLKRLGYRFNHQQVEEGSPDAR